MHTCFPFFGTKSLSCRPREILCKYFDPIMQCIFVFLTLFSTRSLALADQSSQHLNRSVCRSSIRTALSNSTILANDTSILHAPLPANHSSDQIFLQVPACERICGSKHEIKDDCAGRIKEWMLPVLLLLVSVEPTAAVTVGVWRALGLYLFAMADPAGMFRGLLGRMRWERRFRISGGEIWEEVQQRRSNTVATGRQAERDGPRTVKPESASEIIPYDADQSGAQELMLISSKKGKSFGGPRVTSIMSVTADVSPEHETEPSRRNRPNSQRPKSSWCTWRRKLSREQEKSKSMAESYGIILSVISDILSDPNTARSALRHAVTKTLPETVPYAAQDQAILDAADSLRFVHTRGVAVAWIAIVVCIVELAFLIVGPLQQQISASPSGAKIASAATFTWLLPLVAISAHLGTRTDLVRSGKEIVALLRKLERG
ncbi:hypothetical protein QBC42DRAFT_266297 [Cladorrhinum samala]|uniref:Uncharacterized protein n=1 Tax=Cladorrhinum samala TaxID=585594 RepID=A0AAV9HU12_9PEZI|nr:hypothetical protein QBC42DRAFT_266297 [Cladorrhinum samala]